MSDKCHLVFVYNADASLKSLLNEARHKLFKSQPAECSLCELTYSFIRQKQSWVAFLEDLSCEYEFHLRNRFLRKHPDKRKDAFPCVYRETAAGDLEVLVPADLINSAGTLTQLQELVAKAVSALPSEQG